MLSHATCSRHHMTEKIFAHIKQHSINQASKTLILLRFLIVHPTEIFSRVSMRGRDMKGEYLVFLWGEGIWKGNISCFYEGKGYERGISRVSMRGRDMKGEYLVFLWGEGIWKGNISCFYEGEGYETGIFCIYYFSMDHYSCSTRFNFQL